MDKKQRFGQMNITITDSLYRSNVLIVGDGNTGKTTFLKKVVDDALKSGYVVLLFDSVTEHQQKSILVHCKNIYSDYQEIISPDKSQIMLRQKYNYEYPYQLICNAIEKQLYLFDVSKYLEEGYLYDDIQQRNEIRHYYKVLAFQCLNIMLNIIDKRKTVVVTDEVEFIPQFSEVIMKYNNNGCYFVSALRNMDSCGQAINNLFYKFDFNELKIKQ